MNGVFTHAILRFRVFFRLTLYKGERSEGFLQARGDPWLETKGAFAPVHGQ